MTSKELDTLKISCGIDTVEIVSDKPAEADLSKKIYVRKSERRRLADDKVLYVLNPDKSYDELNIYSASTYYQQKNKMLDEMKLTNPTLTRCDFRFDYFAEGSYDKLLKLNAAVVMLLSEKYRVKNTYESHDLITGEALTVRAQNHFFEAEFYNKCNQEPDGNVTARLELRSKDLENGTTEEEALDYWFSMRLAKSVTREQYNDVQDRLNLHLLEAFEKEQKQHSMTIPEFVYRHQDKILTPKQLMEFLRVIKTEDGKAVYDDPKQTSYKIIERRHLQTIKFKQIETYIEVLRKSADEFLKT